MRSGASIRCHSVSPMRSFDRIPTIDTIGARLQRRLRGRVLVGIARNYVIVTSPIRPDTSRRTRAIACGSPEPGRNRIPDPMAGSALVVRALRGWLHRSAFDIAMFDGYTR